MKRQARIVLAVLLMTLVVFVRQSRAQEIVDVFIGFQAVPGPSEQALVRGQGGVIKYSYHLVPAIAASIPEPAIERLLRNPNVTYIEPDIEVYAIDIDAELDDSWGVKRIGAGTVHDGFDGLNKGKGVNVAIIDSGIDKDHPDLAYNIAGGINFVGTGPLWRRNPDAWDDDNGHGTHVAGTVAALDDGVGVVGVAPEASLYALKVLNSSATGSYSAIIAALEWVVDNGEIYITNNSYGSSGVPGTTVETAFYNAALAGILNVCAAGNTGNESGTGDNVIYPARYESCIAVAATDQSDSRASFSSTGPDVELAAPGVDIYSTYMGGGYGTMSGTSMACPHVAGTLALILQFSIFDTADDLGDLGRDWKYGWGLVNAAAAAGVSGTFNNTPIVEITSPVDGSTFASGETISFAGTASDTEDDNATLTAALAWTSSIDGPGPIGTGGSFSAILSDGNHTITASVTDSGSKTGSASISITVGTPTEATTVSVASITYDTEGGRNQGKHLLITVALVDDLGGSVAGASVSIDLLLDSSLDARATGTTGAYGTVTFSRKNAPSGKYTTTVTDVTAAGLNWYGGTPANEYDKS